MLSARPLCIYHGHCPDGFTAAWVVNKALEGNVDFHAGIYQDAPPDIAGRDVIMVDFSYKRPVLHDMAKSARRILILDHHQTAAEDLARLFTPPVWSVWRNLDGLSQGVRVTALFDMDRSGAQLAWDYFTDGSQRPNLIDYVGDRDLWRFQLPHSRAVNALVTSYDYEFRNWDFLDALMRDDMGVQQAAEIGGAIERNHHKDVAELVNVTCRRMRIGGYLVPVANIPHTMASDAGHLMARGEAFAALLLGYAGWARVQPALKRGWPGCECHRQGVWRRWPPPCERLPPTDRLGRRWDGDGAGSRAARYAGLISRPRIWHAASMFSVSEAEARAIRDAFHQRGEFSAVVELRRLFPGVTDNRQARECVRMIAGWQPLPLRPVRRRAGQAAPARPPGA